MIEIFVEGRQMCIPEGTTITMEQSNNLLGGGDIGSDIVWTFDVPATDNAHVLDNAQYVYVNGARRYDAEMRHDGAPVARGSLYVQSAKEDSLGCGMTINEISKGWGSRYLKDNDYGEDTIIASTRNEHLQKWKEFLKGTLADDSDVKFMLFCASGFMKENEDFGSHVHAEIDRASGTTLYTSRLSGLENEDVLSTSNSPQFRSYVNRLFSDANGEVINLSDYYSQGARVGNTEISTGKQNGYTFCPAMRATHVIAKMFEKDGYMVFGSFMNDARAKNIFIQSLRTMDGDVYQYEVEDWVRLGVSRRYTMENDATISPNALQFYGLDEAVYNYVKVYAGEYLINTVPLSFRYKMALTNDLNPNQQASGIFTKKEEAYIIVATVGNATIPSEVWRSGKDSANCGAIKDANSLCGQQSGVDVNIVEIVSGTNNEVIVVYRVGIRQTMIHTRLNVSDLGMSYMQITRTSGYEAGNWMSDNCLSGAVSGGINVNGNVQSNVVFRLCRCSVSTFQGDRTSYYPGTTDSVNWHASSYGDIAMLTDITEVGGYVMRNTNRPFNIFSNKFSLNEHVPNMTNSDLLKTMINMFGLNLYVNSQTKEVELSYHKDIDGAMSIDITPYVLNKATERSANDPKRYEVVFGTCREQKDDENSLEAVLSRDGLPEAKYYPNRSIYVENENAYRKSTKIESSEDDEDQPASSSIYYSWKLQHGNDKKLEVGDEKDDVQEVKIDVNIPNMRVVDTSMTTPKYLQEITKNGISQMFDNSFDGEFDLVVTQYRGKRLLPLVRVDNTETLFPRKREAYIEEANPTCYDEEGNVVEGYWNLSASGEHSVGEECLRGLYELKANNVPVRIEAIVPADVFRSIYALNMPQNRPIKKQTRWVLYRNQRYLPVNISYEFGNGDNVGVVIEAIRKG